MLLASAPHHQPALPIPAAGPAGMPAPWPRSRRWATPAGAQLVSIERRAWSRVETVVRSLRCDRSLKLDLSADRPQLIFVLEQVGGRVDIGPGDTPSRSASRVEMRAPHFSVVPAGAPVWASLEKVSFLRGMTLQFDADIDEDGIDLRKAFAPRMMNTDSRLMRLANLVAEECISSRLRDKVFEDSLTLALLSGLSHLPGSRKGGASRGGLAPWQLRKVDDYLRAHIGESLRLERLAEVAHLSLSHFCRSFKTATGIAPHQWILQARIDRARELLLQPRARLADVAVETGFADQAHFTRAFGRAVGQSPGAWQRSRSA